MYKLDLVTKVENFQIWSYDLGHIIAVKNDREECDDCGYIDHAASEIEYLISGQIKPIRLITSYVSEDLRDEFFEKLNEDGLRSILDNASEVTKEMFGESINN